jgi:Chaperone of endosialidase
MTAAQRILKSLAWVLIPTVALAATVYPYFPPPGITYTPAGGMALGTPTGGVQGANTLNATQLYVQGTPVTTGSIPAAANPTASVGLTAVNGSATTYTRSDAAAPLDQTISPTMTGPWNFTHAGAPPVTVTSSQSLVNLHTTATRGTGQDWITYSDPTGNKGAVGFNSAGSDDFYVENDMASSTHIYSNGIDRIGVDLNGSVFMNQPTGGTGNTLLINLPVHAYGLLVGSNAITTGNSFGEEIQAGTNSTDTAFAIINQAATQTYFKVRGDGVISMPQIVSSSAAQTGTVCWSAAQITYDTTLGCLSSSLRFKQHIEPLDAGLAEVMALHPVSYERKPAYNPTHLGREIGLVAEEVAVVDERLIARDDQDRPLGVRYMQLTALLIRALQDQQHEIEALRAGTVKKKPHEQRPP